MAVQKAVSLARTKHRAAEIADGKGRWTGRPQDDPGSFADEGNDTPEHGVPDTPDRQPQEESEKIRVPPGQSLKPSTTDVFERLHAYHADPWLQTGNAPSEAEHLKRLLLSGSTNTNSVCADATLSASLEKKALLQKLAAQQVDAQTESLKRCTVRTCSSEEEALQIYGRLYQEAAHRRRTVHKSAKLFVSFPEKHPRRRQVEREQEETLSSQCSSSSLRSQVEGPPRWEKLYHSAPLKEKRLGDERKRAAEAEERWLAQHCIHRSSDKTEAAEIFDRLYGESESRERRREQRKAAEVASQVRELAESSVHSRTLSVADLELRTRRLYEDGLQRLQRLEDSKYCHAILIWLHVAVGRRKPKCFSRLPDAGTGFRAMKVLFFAALAAPIVDSAVLLRSQDRAWYAGSAKAEPADCNAPCAWDCGTPECSQSCKAERPSEQQSKQSHGSDKAKFASRPDASQPVRSHKSRIAGTSARIPSAGWYVHRRLAIQKIARRRRAALSAAKQSAIWSALEAGVRPAAKIPCATSTVRGCHNKTIDLPFAYRLETNAQTSAAAAASPAVKSISAAAEEGEVAWKGLAKA
eukprot:s5224_g4.t1